MGEKMKSLRDDKSLTEDLLDAREHAVIEHIRVGDDNHCGIGFAFG